MYVNVVQRVRDAFETEVVVRLDCTHVGTSDCKRIGVKLRVNIYLLLFGFFLKFICKCSFKIYRNWYHVSQSCSRRSKLLCGEERETKTIKLAAQLNYRVCRCRMRTPLFLHLVLKDIEQEDYQNHKVPLL